MLRASLAQGVMDQVASDIVFAERVRDEHVTTVKRLSKENQTVRGPCPLVVVVVVSDGVVVGWLVCLEYFPAFISYPLREPMSPPPRLR